MTAKTVCLHRASSPATAGAEEPIIAEAQGKDLKTAVMNTVEVLKKEVNTSLKEIYEDTVKDLKVEKELIRKTQTQKVWKRQI